VNIRLDDRERGGVQLDMVEGVSKVAEGRISHFERSSVIG